MAIFQQAQRRIWALGGGIFISLGLTIFASAAAAATQAEITQIITEEAAKNGRVPLPLALAVAKVESNLHDDAVSGAGARGVMQIMPATAMGEFGVPATALGEPRLNVRLGIAYLERLYNRYDNWELALSHYNGGTLPAAAGQFVAHDYTRQYVADVMKWADTYRNDATIVALADTDHPAPVQLASADAPPAPEQVVADEKVPVSEAAMPPVAPTHEAVSADAADPSMNELRARFRASLDQRREAGLRPTDTRPGATSSSPGQVVRSGRFTYAPYGG